MKTINQYPYSICRERGFTLIQTMVTLGLIGLALAVLATLFARLSKIGRA